MTPTPPTASVEGFTVVARLPDACLSPNARPHWATRSRAVKKQRDSVCNAIRFIYPQFVDARWESATIRYDFYFPVRRNRDDDNFRAMMKSARDAFGPETMTRAGRIVPGAGVVVDDSVISDAGEVGMKIDKANPRVEITIERNLPTAGSR